MDPNMWEEPLQDGRVSVMWSIEADTVQCLGTSLWW